MVAAPPNFRGDLKISDQNNSGRPEQKIIIFIIIFFFWGGGARSKGGPKILGGAYEPQ